MDSRLRGNDGSEAGNDGSEAGNDGSEEGNDGSEAGNDGSEDGKEYVVVIPAKAGIQRQHRVTDFSGMTRSGSHRAVWFWW